MNMTFAIVGLNFLSAVMTGAGIFTFLLPWAERLAPGSAALVAACVAGGFTLVIQRLVYGLWWRVGTEGAFRPATNLVVAMLASSLSWGGAAGGFALLVSQLDLIAAREQAEAAATTAPLRRFATDFADLRGELTVLAARSRQLAEAEAAGQPTCSNDTSTGTGCGPRCRLRQAQAEAITAEEAAVRALEEAARGLAAEMSSATGAAAQRAIYARAITLQGNGTQPAIAAALRARAEDFGRPLPTGTTRGGTFICEDADTAARLRALAARVEQRIALPEMPPRAQTVDMSDTLGCVVARLGEAAGLSVRCAGASVDGPMMMALVLEAILAALILAEAGRRRRLGLLPTGTEAAATAMAAGAAPFLMLNGSWLVRMASLHVIDAPPEGRFFAVPVDGAPEARAEADRFVRLMRWRAPAFVNVPLDSTDPDWVAARADALGGATRFNLHRWTVEADTLLERAYLAGRAPGDGPSAAARMQEA